MTIKVSKPKNTQALLEKAKSDAEKYGISYSGDITGGRASGMGFEGSYTVDENFIIIEVLKKPIFVSGARIEKEVSRYISQ
ncbi:MAG: hypothetical protein FWC70_02260 [Defluviitaleaceae bacterium]|nr:hypothetical protein [Defluviitaleaceae bacterium]